MRVTRGSGAEVSATRARYDGYGRATAIEAPNGTTMSFSHDPNGNVLRQAVLGAGEKPLAEVVQTFDAMDRLIRRAPRPRRDRTSRRELGVRRPGPVVRRDRPAGRSWRARYDALDRPVEVDDGPAG